MRRKVQKRNQTYNITLPKRQVEAIKRNPKEADIELDKVKKLFKIKLL